VIDAAGRSDAGAFLVRLLRLDPAAVVRLRPSRPADGRTEIWAMLPFGVLATRHLATGIDADMTFDAAGLLAALNAGVSTLDRVARRDADWRWPLPSSRGTAVESIPAAEIVRIAAAASHTLRAAAEQGVGGRAVPERALRDALLDHVPIVVTVTGTGDEAVRVPQRVVQAVVRMGFLGSVVGPERASADARSEPVERSGPVTLGDNFVTVRLSIGWIGVDASYGSVWHRPTSPLRLS
jgi:hypothetical protein